MDNRKIVLLVGALVMAGLMAFMARTLVAGAAAPQAVAMGAPAAAPPVDGPQVLVATRALPVGTILDATALKFQPWPKELVDGAYYLKDRTDLKTLQGTVVRSAVTAGQPVTQGALVKPGDRGFLAAALAPGMRAVTIPVSAQSAVAGFVFPGDRIDVVLTQSVTGGGDGQPLKVSETILRDVRVLATDQRTDNTADEAGKTVVKTFGTVTVEATPRIAEQLAVAQTLGQISLSLRSLADTGEQMQQAIVTGRGKTPAGDQAVVARFASQPQIGDSTFATGADVSRFARRSVPGKTGGSGGAPAAAAAPSPSFDAPTVRVARGAAMTPVTVAPAAKAPAAASTSSSNSTCSFAKGAMNCTQTATTAPAGEN